MVRSSASGTKIMKCTVPEQQRPIPCPRLDTGSESQCMVESVKSSRASERLGKGCEVPGVVKEWTQGVPMAWLVDSWVPSLGFPTNCMQNPSSWVFTAVIHS